MSQQFPAEGATEGVPAAAEGLLRVAEPTPSAGTSRPEDDGETEQEGTAGMSIGMGTFKALLHYALFHSRFFHF